MKKVKITCSAAADIDYHKLKEIQGALKSRSSQDIDRMINSILNYGFSFPFFVWPNGKTNYVLDGHGRLEALSELESQGYEIPPLPVAYIKAKNREEAKQKLLRMNSQYGTITLEGLQEFTVDMNVDWDEVQLPGGKISLSPDEDDETYTSKVSTPIYQITGDKPSERELYDQTKTDELLSQIQKADIPDTVRAFLQAAAHRHTVFNYGKIAEYYAHAPKDIQRLMESSALVIIDFDKAIESGFVRLSKEVKKLYEQEHGTE